MLPYLCIAYPHLWFKDYIWLRRYHFTRSSTISLLLIPLCPGIQSKSTACAQAKLFSVWWYYRKNFGSTVILWKFIRTALCHYINTVFCSFPLAQICERRQRYFLASVIVTNRPRGYNYFLTFPPPVHLLFCQFALLGWSICIPNFGWCSSYLKYSYIWKITFRVIWQFDNTSGRYFQKFRFVHFIEMDCFLVNHLVKNPSEWQDNGMCCIYDCRWWSFMCFTKNIQMVSQAKKLSLPCCWLK